MPSRPQIDAAGREIRAGDDLQQLVELTVRACRCTLTIASQISRRLCGSRLHAMPTAMPVEPLTSRLGNLLGKNGRLHQRVSS